MIADAHATTYSIGEAAAMVGLTPDTIRSWERRYRMVSPTRAPNNRRRYTLGDVEALLRAKKAARGRSLSLRLAAVELELGHLADLVLPGVPPAAPAPEPCDAGPWRSAGDLLPHLVLVLDGEGRVVDANVAVARAVGTVRSRLRGLRFADMVEPYDRAKAVRTYLTPSPTRRGWELNLEFGRLTGMYSFDCWTVAAGGRRFIVMIGRGLAGR